MTRNAEKKIKNDILLRHYNKKYPSDEDEEIQPVSVSSYPNHRDEAVVYWAGKGESLLEVGCGSGNVLLTLKDDYSRCIGVELAQTRYNQLKNLFSKCSNIQLINGNIEDKDLEIAPSSIDTIIINAVVEHLIEPISALQYLEELLKPKGRIIITTPNFAKWTRRIKLFLGRFPSTASLNEGLTAYDKKTSTLLYDDGHLHYFTYRSLKKLLIERVGFSCVTSKGFGKPCFLTATFPKLFSSECLLIAVKK